jgi:divalent metal cation (Fe/Co/Zn/Cd) transporter
VSAAHRRDELWRPARLATVTGAILIVVKVALALVTGSVAVLAEASHAAAELLRTIVSAIVLRDEARPSGAGGNPGLWEGVLVIAGGIVTLVAAFDRFGEVVDRPYLGSAGLGACAVAAAVTANRVQTVARRTGSRALLADAASLRSSQWTAGAAAVALLLVGLVHVNALDALAALGIALAVLRLGVELVQSTRPGTARPTAAELARVAEAVADGPLEVVGFGRVTTRSAAGVRRIDVDVLVGPASDAQRDGRIARELRSRIAARLPGLRVVVHLRKPHPSVPASVRRRNVR